MTNLGAGTVTPLNADGILVQPKGGVADPGLDLTAAYLATSGPVSTLNNTFRLRLLVNVTAAPGYAFTSLSSALDKAAATPDAAAFYAAGACLGGSFGTPAFPFCSTIAVGTVFPTTDGTTTPAFALSLPSTPVLEIGGGVLMASGGRGTASASNYSFELAATQTVPEPATAGFVVFALAGTLAARRRLRS